MNTHGFKQKVRMNHEENVITAPVTNEVTIRVTLVIIISLQLLEGALHVKG